MVVMVMVNSQMGVCCFEKDGLLALNCIQNLPLSCGFLIPPKPSYGVTLKTKKIMQDRVFGLRTRNSGPVNVLSKQESGNRLVDSGLLEKEFEFKPSFDEYLKAMESVKEKQQTHHSNRDKLRNDSSRKDALTAQPSEGAVDNAKLDDFKGQSCQDRSGSLKQSELCNNSNGVTHREGVSNGNINCKERGSGILKDSGRIGFKEKDNIGSAYSSAQDKLEGAESKMNVNVKRRLGVNTANGRWVKNKSYDQLEGHTFGRNKHGFRSNEMHRRLEKDCIKAEKDSYKRIALKTVELSRSSEPTLKNNVYEVGMERAAFKSFEVSNDVFDKPRVTRMEMEERIQKLAKSLNGADIDMPEWMFAKMMRSAKIRFSDHSVLRVIQILGKLGNWRRVLQVIEWIQLRERFKSHKIRYIYTAALDALGKARRPVEALNVFNAMQQHMSTYPDLVAYRCIAVTLGQAGHLKELFDVIDSMRSPPTKKFKTGVLEKWDPRLEPDIVVFNAVLNACVRRKQWEGAFWALQQLKQQGQQPSSTTYGLVMEVMFACGKYNLVHEFFKKVQKSSIPNALTYKVLVNTLWREGRTDEAILAVQDMERRGIVGSAGLYYDLARCLCSTGRFQEALVQIDKICKVAKKPLVVTYTGLIQACLDGGDVQNGAYIFNHMQKFCSPNLVTCNIMLKAYVEHGMFEEAKELFQKMLEGSNHISSISDYKNRIMPDIYTFNTMLEACLIEQRWDDLSFVYKQMLHFGHHFNAKRHLRMIFDACRAGKEELLETTWKHLAQADRIPPPPLVKEMFRMKLEHDDCAAALSCINSNHLSELSSFSRKVWSNFFEENSHRFQKDTLVRLIHESSILVSRSETQNIIFENLITSCREFLMAHITVAGTSQTETVGRFNVKQL